METKFTPGPWSLGQFRKLDPKVFVYGLAPDGVNRPRIATVEFGMFCGNKIEAETRANAHLIAAAPDMYEALADCAALVRLKYGSTDESANVVQENARAALAKARGESA